MKLQYLAVLAMAFACAHADAATKESATVQFAQSADVNPNDNVGFTPLAVATQQVDAIAKAIQGYVDKFHSVPPLRHQQLFALLDGQNPQKYRFLSLASFRRNAHGEVVDPWQEPYRIEKEPGRIIVTSRKIHYVRAATLARLPAKSTTKTNSG